MVVGAITTQASMSVPSPLIRGRRAIPRKLLDVGPEASYAHPPVQWRTL